MTAAIPLVALALPGASHAASAERSSPEATARELLDSTGTTDHLATLAKYLALEVSELSELDDARRSAVGRAIQRSFDEERLLEAVTEQFVKRYDPLAADAALEWYGSSTGRKIRDTESKALANKVAVARYLKTVETYPPSPARRDLAARYAKATRRHEVALQSSLAVTESAVRGLRALMLDASAIESEEHVDHYMAEKRSELDRAIEKRETFRVLYMHGRLMLPDIERLIDFLETPAGQWLYTTIYLAVDDALAQARGRFVASLQSASGS